MIFNIVQTAPRLSYKLNPLSYREKGVEGNYYCQNPTLTHLNSKQLKVTKVQVRHSSHVFHHQLPQTFPPLLDMLGR